MVNLLDLSLNELKDFIKNLGEKEFRAKQIFDWIYKGKDFDEMINIPKSLRDQLKEESYLSIPKVEKIQISKDGTRKYLFTYRDGISIESVFMKYKFGNSICVSTQAGCRMGCKFCASTINGLDRNLTSGEILGEILASMRESGEIINHIVLMGTGEPFDNYDNIKKFITLVHDGLGLSMRNITVSTCGIIPKIKEFSKDFKEVNLAISLHETTDEKRSNLMPINLKYHLEDLIAACKEYVKETNRRITFEYTLVSDINDNMDDAKRLASLLKGLLCHVNLIPLNEVSETGLKTVDLKKAYEFQSYLNDKGIPCTIRRELGEDIDAACGQLRLSKKSH